ncbi:MAG: hypothetical protein ACK5ML_11790 [Lachnospiraceae bacterium]
MKYRIEYCDGKCCGFAKNRNDLLDQLKKSNREITDIRKLYKSGVSDSVIETYKQYVSK